MLQMIKTIYRNGAFVPQTPVDFPEGAEVEISVENGKNQNETKKKSLAEFVSRASKRAISDAAPRRFTREELHERD